MKTVVRRISVNKSILFNKQTCVSGKFYAKSYQTVSPLNLYSNDPLNIPKFDFINYKRSFCQNIATCWNCQKGTERKNLFFCDTCGSLQDVSKDLNYFNVFSVDKKFNINSTELTSKFRQLQNLVHPDKYSNKNEREKNNSQDWSSLINKAYKTLLTPITRGEYMMKLQGISMPQDNSSLDKEFLMEMMERNEEIDDANEDNIEELYNKVKGDLDIEAQNLNKFFMDNDYDGAKYCLVKIKYFKSIENSIKNKLERYAEVSSTK